MGLPVEFFGEIPIYVIESFIRGIMLSTLMGVCSAFILSSLSICTQFKMLGKKIENLKGDDPEILDALIKEHKKFLR